MSTASNNNSRTVLFVGLAAACLAITVAAEYMRRPEAIQEFGRNGEQFYPEFADPTLASSLEVFAFDKDDVRPLSFSVRRDDQGRWIIPSHRDYPADAEDQLAQTAASVIGITRGALVTRWPAEHARYGVINPDQESLNVEEVDGVGKRLKLLGDGNTVLVDYIIGNQVDGEDSDDYYVRHPDEDEVYITTLDIDLSTKFADWIDTDLLHISQSDIVGLTINDYAFDEARQTISQGETSVLSREKSTDPWQLAGLNADVEEVDKDGLSAAVREIDNLKIIGVRRKKAGLTPDLKLDRKAIRAQQDVEILQADLMTRGFLLQPDETPESLKLISREGELYASTSDGLVYRMYFGRAFTGTQEELEIDLDSDGNDTTDGAEQEADTEDTDADASAKDEEGDSDEQPETDRRPGRYVFVRVEFNETNLGDRPVEPVAPEMPEELKQAESESAAEATEEQPADGDTESADSTDENKDGEEAPQDPLQELRNKYEQDKAKYDRDLKSYTSAHEAFEKKIEDGMKKAEELNRRFADWYYVVSGESFDKLRLSRKDLVKDKEQPEEAAADQPNANTPPMQLTPGAAPAEPAQVPADKPQPEAGAEESEKADTPAEAKENKEPPAEKTATEEQPKEAPKPSEPSAEPEPASDESAAETSDEPAADAPAEPETAE